jgi:hypothetical protein
MLSACPKPNRGQQMLGCAYRDEPLRRLAKRSSRRTPHRGAIVSESDPLIGMHFWEDRGETYVFGEVIQSPGEGFYLARLEERPEAKNPLVIITRAEMVARRWLLFENQKDLRSFLEASEGNAEIRAIRSSSS